MRDVDLAIIGAGPAGMAAAGVAADAGLSVLLLDEQKRVGGQIYRDVERAGQQLGAILGADYLAGMPLVRALRQSRIDYVPGATVWQIEDGKRIAFTVDGAASVVSAKRLLIATGALERPMPVPGWTLPGVMTAGAAQILLKQSGFVLEKAVLVGSGPLLYLLAAQMCRAGSSPLALVETQTTSDAVSAALRHGGGVLAGRRYVAKGLRMLSEIRKAGVRRYVGATQIAIDGTTEASGIRFEAEGRRQNIECATVLLHHGVVPNTQIARSVGVPHHWNECQRAFIPDRDIWGRTPVANIFIAGDGAGIGGATAAELAGRLAALEIASDLEAVAIPDRDRQAGVLRQRLRDELRIRPFLDRAYPPYAGALLPADETVICRCEEVTAGDVRRYARIGCLGPNQTKAFGRVGMGPCQGRYCGLAVTELLADANKRSHDETGYYRIRPPVKPVTLSELAALAEPNNFENQTEAME